MRLGFWSGVLLGRRCVALVVGLMWLWHLCHLGRGLREAFQRDAIRVVVESLWLWCFCCFWRLRLLPGEVLVDGDSAVHFAGDALGSLWRG